MKDELKPIVEGLLKKSRDNKVAWHHASTVSTFSDMPINPSSEDYAVSTSSYTINLFRVNIAPANEKKGIRINILNETGEVAIGDTISAGEREYEMMQELLDMARKSSLGGERILKSILESLNKPGVFGSTDTEPPPF